MADKEFRGCCHNADCDGFENCIDCWNDYKANHPITNGEWLRSLDDEALADRLSRIWRQESKATWLDWLKQPRESEG